MARRWRNYGEAAHLAAHDRGPSRGGRRVSSAGLNVARGNLVQVSIQGIERTDDRLAGMTARLQNLKPVAPTVFRLLEEGEKAHFKRLRGRYVRTGRTRDSLTGRTRDSIRRVEREGLVFGTSVWYAVFLRKPKRGKKVPVQDSSLAPLKRSQGRRSAVLAFTPKTRRAANEAILAYVTGAGELR